MNDTLIIFGAKISSLIAAFAGSVISLTYLRNLEFCTGLEGT